MPVAAPEFLVAIVFEDIGTLQDAVERRRQVFVDLEAVSRQPELKSEIQSIQWLGFALTEATVFYGFIAGLIAFFV